MICIHMWSVAQVSLHASIGRAGHASLKRLAVLDWVAMLSPCSGKIRDTELGHPR
jgi:hypothetical protein